MRKKLDTRFPAARIKKIMQADEDVGKIAMAVPLLVSKALELFLQDLCDRTYEITLQKGAKTLNSMHLKQCVQSFNVFDFLRDIVGKVPDLGGSDAAGEDKSATKRRKVADGDHNEGAETEDSRRDKPVRGRGRGRGRGRISRAEKESNTVTTFSFHNHDPNLKNPKPTDYPDSKQNQNMTVEKTEETVKVRNFDLNLDLDENGNSPVISTGPARNEAVEIKGHEYPGWSLADVEKMAIDPVKLVELNSRVDEDEEDYDEEG